MPLANDEIKQEAQEILRRMKEAPVRPTGVPAKVMNAAQELVTVSTVYDSVRMGVTPVSDLLDAYVKFQPFPRYDLYRILSEFYALLAIEADNW